MALATGTRVGTYEVIAQIGAGGMGEVYRACDTTLNRDVALKVLPEKFAADPERVTRFKREAQVLAALNHPNIAAIYGLEESSGAKAFVLELVEGPTLAERIAAGPLAVGEALDIARQLAEALEAAHDKGIVHRDLKPANIKITPSGVVKVLDFGLAKLVRDDVAATGAVDLTNVPTVTVAATHAGALLGTAAYMSPEQARGQAVDKRTDVWAFGCVFYEMLASRPVFNADNTAEAVSQILTSEPDWTRLRPAPAAARRVLRRCLQKDRRLRLQCIGDARIEIEEAAHEPEESLVATTRRDSRVAWTAAVLVTLIALLETAWFLRAPAESRREVRFEVTTPTTTDPISLAISPDSSKVAFVASSDGRSRLWLRSLDDVSARALPGTDEAFFPFWAPDSQSLGFFASGRLNRIDLDTGLVRQLATAPNPLGGSWNREGTIVFAPNFTGPLFKIAATGGDSVPVTRLETRQASHRFPQFLPDGRKFLYFVTGTDAQSVFVGQLDSGVGRRVLDADAPAVYASNQLLFVRQSSLFTQEIDLANLAVRGNPVAIASHVPVDGITNLAALSASDSGAVVYRSGPASGERQLIWFDRTGAEISRVGEPDRATPYLSLSPDGRRVVMSRSANGNVDIWTLDLGRDVLSRVTVDAAAESVAVWSPDGTRVAFNSNRTGIYDLYVKSATDTGNDDLLLKTEQNKAPVDWSPDGRFLLYRSPGKTTGFDLWALPVEGDRKPFPVVQTTFEERDGQFSPDGQWIAYQSNESGPVEVYVQQFKGGRREKISTGGGAQARWGPDGKELFYIAPDGRLMAVPIRTDSGRSTIEAGVPVPLFATHVGGAVQGANLQQYAVSPDGRRFLMSTLVETRTPVITVILNWRPRS